MLQKELPNVSAQLLDILTLERRHQFLPNDVAAIVMRLIDVRNAIFSNAAERFTRDYR